MGSRMGIAQGYFLAYRALLKRSDYSLHISQPSLGQVQCRNEKLKPARSRQRKERSTKTRKKPQSTHRNHLQSSNLPAAAPGHFLSLCQAVSSPTPNLTNKKPSWPDRSPGHWRYSAWTRSSSSMMKTRRHSNDDPRSQRPTTLHSPIRITFSPICSHTSKHHLTCVGLCSQCTRICARQGHSRVWTCCTIYAPTNCASTEKVSLCEPHPRVPVTARSSTLDCQTT